jgi:hydrogenase maturation protease
MAPRRILIGLGNPIMSDDRAGLAVAGEVHKRLPDLDLDLTCSNGFEIVDRLLGYDLAVIIDSMTTGRHKPGTVVRLAFERSMCTLRASTSHGVGFGEAIEIARGCGAGVPGHIVVYGIEVRDPHSVGSEMSAEVSGKIGEIADEIARDLMGAAGLDLSGGGG